MAVAGHYGFGSVTGSIKGPGGFADLSQGSAEEGITIESMEDQSTVEVGADGFISHSLSASTAHNLTVRLSKVSPINRILMVMANLQQADPRLNGINIVSFRDVHSGDFILCEFVAFTKWASINYAKVAGINEWSFIASRTQRILGGL